MYIELIELLDRGDPLTRNYLIVVFNKTDTVDPDSEIGKFLGNITMPLDLVGIYKVKTITKKDKETGEEKIIYKKGVSIREISNEEPFVRARDVFRYTRNLYDSDFLMVRKCEVKREMKEIPIYTPLPGALCSEDEKYPEGLIEEISEEILVENNKDSETSKELLEIEDKEQKAKELDKQMHEIEKKENEIDKTNFKR